MGEEHRALQFTLTRNCPANGAANGGHAPKTFTAILGAKAPIRIGRASSNDVIVDSRGVSQYHAELRLMAVQGESTPQLVLRDLSTNGTGLKQPVSGSQAVALEKEVDAPLRDGCEILVPMLLKVTQEASDRAWFKLEILGWRDLDEKDAEAGSKAGKTKSSSKKTDDPEKAEVNRTKFVNLLLNTKEVSAGTTYKQAEALLADTADWYCVDVTERKECFEIFVDHLKSSTTKKKKKSKSKKKSKDVSEAEEQESEDGAAATPDPKVSRSGRKHHRKSSADGGKKSKRTHKKTSRRSRSVENDQSPNAVESKRRRRRSRSASE